MNHFIKMETVIRRLEEAKIEFGILRLQNDWSVIICRYGGRLFGPFRDMHSESLLWMNGAFSSASDFQALVNARHWNVGGDRFWIAPELPFFVRDKKRFFDSYEVQPALDPGNYVLSELGQSFTLSQEVELAVFESELASKRFSMERSVRMAQLPLTTGKLPDGIEYFGLSQTLSIKDSGEDNSLYLEAWLLSQINPRGTLIVPFTGTSLNYTDYYEAIDAQKISIDRHIASFDVTGDVRYKLGFKALQMTGRSAYLGRFEDGTAYLFVRNYFNNPSNIYSAAPYFAPKQYGCSLFLYNDPGSQGGFAEFENCCSTLSGDTGITAVEDRIQYYFFVGEQDRLMDFAKGSLL